MTKTNKRNWPSWVFQQGISEMLCCHCGVTEGPITNDMVRDEFANEHRDCVPEVEPGHVSRASSVTTAGMPAGFADQAIQSLEAAREAVAAVERVRKVIKQYQDLNGRYALVNAAQIMDLLDSDGIWKYSEAGR